MAGGRMGSSPGSAGRLSEFQHFVLEAFFARESSFYLTGGAALAPAITSSIARLRISIYSPSTRTRSTVRATCCEMWQTR